MPSWSYFVLWRQLRVPRTTCGNIGVLRNHATPPWNQYALAYNNFVAAIHYLGLTNSLQSKHHPKIRSRVTKQLFRKLALYLCNKFMSRRILKEEACWALPIFVARSPVLEK